jgi:hypothetical protein
LSENNQMIQDLDNSPENSSDELLSSLGSMMSYYDETLSDSNSECDASQEGILSTYFIM